MIVHWSLRGLCVHNVVLGMCISPTMHRHLTMEQRCEIGLSGFLCLDMFRLVADKHCADLQLPRGSCFYAGQTIANLQSTALAGVVMTVSKPPGFTPWSQGYARLTELPIEQHFGQIRTQSSSAQHTTRSFLIASARLAQRTSRTLNKMKPKTSKPENPLTEEEPLDLFFFAA